jgi:hypothetical protein
MLMEVNFKDEMYDKEFKIQLQKLFKFNRIEINIPYSFEVIYEKSKIKKNILFQSEFNFGNLTLRGLWTNQKDYWSRF